MIDKVQAFRSWIGGVITPTFPFHASESYAEKYLRPQINQQKNQSPQAQPQNQSNFHPHHNQTSTHNLPQLLEQPQSSSKT